MIDISQETLVPIREVPRLLPPRPNGKRVHISACYRWLSRGVKGIVLESVKIGGSTYTSREALQRFAEQLSPVSRPNAPLYSPTPASRRRHIEEAARQAEAILGSRRAKKPSRQPYEVSNRSPREQ